MSIYNVYYTDGTTERLTITFMSTETFRRAHGGKTNNQIVIGTAKERAGNRHIAKITRLTTGETIYTSEN